MRFQDTLGVRLRVAYLTFHRRVQAQLAPFGLTADQFVLLSLLAEEGGLTQRELVQRSGSDSSTIGAMMQLLDREKLIRRTRHTRDGRALCVHLTPKGRRTQRELAESIRPLRKRLNDALPVGTPEVVLEALEQIANAMESWPCARAEVA